MRIAGVLLLGVGALLTLYAFMMDTTVYSSPTLIGGSYIGGGSTHNLGLLQQQMMVLHTGLAAFLAGAFILANALSAPWFEGRADGAHSSPTQRDETEEEREERLAKETLSHRITGLWLLVLLLMLGWAVWNEGQTDYSSADETMAVENLVVEDDTMAVENLVVENLLIEDMDESMAVENLVIPE